MSSLEVAEFSPQSWTLGMYRVPPNGTRLIVTAAVEWDPTDPLAVTFDWPAQRWQEVGMTWTIGRKLVEAGLDKEVDTGDVLIRPGSEDDPSDDRYVFMGLQTPPEVSRLVIPRQGLAPIVEAILQRVPANEDIQVSDALEVFLMQNFPDAQGKPARPK